MLKNICKNGPYVVKADWPNQRTFSIVNIIRFSCLMVLAHNYFGSLEYPKL